MSLKGIVRVYHWRWSTTYQRNELLWNQCKYFSNDVLTEVELACLSSSWSWYTTVLLLIRYILCLTISGHVQDHYPNQVLQLHPCSAFPMQRVTSECMSSLQANVCAQISCAWNNRGENVCSSQAVRAKVRTLRTTKYFKLKHAQNKQEKEQSEIADPRQDLWVVFA